MMIKKIMQNIKKNSIDRIFLKNLVCPLTKSDLIYLKKEHELISLQSKLAYPINQDIPLMHIDFARKITNKEISILLKES